jgi:TolB protein
MFLKNKILLFILSSFLLLILAKCIEDNSMISNKCSDIQIDLSQYINNSKILFISRRVENSGVWGLYSMNVDGSDQQILTDKSVRCTYPSISSDGKIIAFVHYSDNNDYELYVLGMEGGVPQLLATGTRYLGHPSWSPDDSKIIFTVNRSDASDTTDIHIIYTDGTNKKWLTYTGDNSCPAWSPDGNLIAFSSYRNGFRGIYLMNSDGSGLTLLTKKESSYTHPQWSPDGQQLVYVSMDFEGSQIFTMDINNRNDKQLTNTVNPEWIDRGFPRDGNNTPKWSPDGSKLAYVSWQNGNPDLYSMNPDGSNKIQLTDSNMRDEQPYWSPVGDYIIFTSKRDMNLNSDIFIMNSNGCNQQPLSNYEREDAFPIWVVSN